MSPTETTRWIGIVNHGEIHRKAHTGRWLRHNIVANAGPLVHPSQ